MKFLVGIEVDVDDAATAELWAASLVDCAQPTCPTCKGKKSLANDRGVHFTCGTCCGSGRSGAHPYRPRVVGARAVQ